MPAKTANQAALAGMCRKPFRDVSAFALSPEWEFLYLAVHAAGHGWLSLKWFIDLDRLCSARILDWEKVGAKPGCSDGSGHCVLA